MMDAKSSGSTLNIAYGPFDVRPFSGHRDSRPATSDAALRGSERMAGRKTYRPHTTRMRSRPASPGKVIHDVLSKSGGLKCNLMKPDVPHFMQTTRNANFRYPGKLKFSAGGSPIESGSTPLSQQVPLLGPKSYPGKLPYKPLVRNERAEDPMDRLLTFKGSSARKNQSEMDDKRVMHSSLLEQWDPVPTRIPVGQAIETYEANVLGSICDDRSAERFTGKRSTMVRPPGWASLPGMEAKLTSPLVGLAFNKAELSEVKDFWKDHFGHQCPYSNTQSLVGGRRKSQSPSLGEFSRTRGLESFAEPKWPPPVGGSPLTSVAEDFSRRSLGTSVSPLKSTAGSRSPTKKKQSKTPRRRKKKTLSPGNMDTEPKLMKASSLPELEIATERKEEVLKFGKGDSTLDEQMAEKQLVSMLNALDQSPRRDSAKKATPRLSPRPELEPLVLHRSNSVPDPHSPKESYKFDEEELFEGRGKTPKRSEQELAEYEALAQPRDILMSYISNSSEEDEDFDYGEGKSPGANEDCAMRSTPTYLQSRAQLIVNNASPKDCKFDVPNTRTPKSKENSAFFGQHSKHDEGHHLQPIAEIQQGSDLDLTIDTLSMEGNAALDPEQPVPLALRTRTNKELKEREASTQPRNFSCLSSDGEEDHMSEQDSSPNESSANRRRSSHHVDTRAQLIVKNPRTPSLQYKLGEERTPKGNVPSRGFFPGSNTTTDAQQKESVEALDSEKKHAPRA